MIFGNLEWVLVSYAMYSAQLPYVNEDMLAADMGRAPACREGRAGARGLFRAEELCLA